MDKIEIRIREHWRLRTTPTKYQKRELELAFIPHGYFYYKEITNRFRCLYALNSNEVFVKLDDGWVCLDYNEYSGKLCVEKFE